MENPVDKVGHDARIKKTVATGVLPEYMTTQRIKPASCYFIPSI